MKGGAEASWFKMPLSVSLENSDMVAIGERVHYLSLALDARRALNAIRAATESLEILSTHADLYAKHSPEHYNQYEEIQILREVSSSLDPEPLIESLKSLLSGVTERATSNDLMVARKFFRALESRALHSYNDPTSTDTVMP